jgi:hypothetical protein
LNYHKNLNYKRIPVPTIFCRAPVFVVSSSRSDVRARKDCADEDTFQRHASFANRDYVIEVKGNFVDHQIDLPLFMILIQEAINYRPAEAKSIPSDIQISLTRLDILLTNPRKSKATYTSIVKSLKRLSTMKLKIWDKKHKVFISDGALISKINGIMDWLDYKAGHISVHLTDNCLNFFPLTNDKKNPKVTFIDLPKLLKVSNGRSRAILKYYASQSKLYTDVTVKSLFKITGVDKLSGSDAKKREHMITALNRLVESGYLVDYKYFKESKIYRCCRADYFKKGQIDTIIKSNLDYFDKFLTLSQQLKKTELMVKDLGRNTHSASDTSFDLDDPERLGFIEQAFEGSVDGEVSGEGYDDVQIPW